MSLNNLPIFSYSTLTNLNSGTFNQISVANETITNILTLSGLTTLRPLKTDVNDNVISTQINLASTNDVVNILSISNGGTNSKTALINNQIMVSSTGSIIEAGNMINGQLLIGSTGAAPVIGSIFGTTNQIIVTPGAGTITLSTPQNINTGASPTFVDMTLTSLTSGELVSYLGSNLVTTISATAPYFTTSVQSPSFILGPNLNGADVAFASASQSNSIIVEIPNVSAGTLTPTMALYNSLSNGYLLGFGAGNNLISSSVSETAPNFTTSITTPLLNLTATSGNEGAFTVPSTLAQNVAYDFQDPGATVSVVMLAISGSTYSDYAVATISAQTLLATPLLALNGTTYNGDLVVPAALGQTTTFTIPDPGQAASNIALSNSSNVSITWVGPNTVGVVNATNKFQINGSTASCSLAGLSLTVAAGTNTVSITNTGTAFPARYRPTINQQCTQMISTGVASNTAPDQIYISTAGIITIPLAYSLTLWTTGCGWPSNMFLSWSLI